MLVWQRDTGGKVSGLIYSVTITVEYCAIGREFRSGMGYDSQWGWLYLPQGSVLANPRAVTLGFSYSQVDLDNAFDDLNQGTSNVDPVWTVSNPAWTNLSQGSSWINSMVANGIYGNHCMSVLYAIDFTLPNPLPANLAATLDMEWAVDDRLSGVWMNDSGMLGVVANAVGPNHYSAPSTSSVSGSTLSWKLKPGKNTLFLLQDDLKENASGINYIINLEIEYACSGYGDTDFVSFCDCIGEVAPCQNPGTPGTGCANTTGLGAILSASGLAQIASSSFELHVSDLPPGATGIFLRGASPINAVPFGQGLLCIGKTSRLNVVKEDGTGRADSGILGGPSQASTVQYQFWYRDKSQNGCKPWNLTNAIAVTWN